MQTSLTLYWMHSQFRPRLKRLELIVTQVLSIAAKRKHTLSRGVSPSDETNAHMVVW